MTGNGHTLSGAICGLPIAYMTLNITGSSIAAISTLSCCVLGSTAPDWLEIPYKSGGKGQKGEKVVVIKRVLKHRGITHIIAMWVICFFWSFLYLKDGYGSGVSIALPITVVAGALGFFAGGILHLMGDIPNKQKVPIFTCYDGISLGLWKSGKFERLTVLILLVCTLAFVYFENNIHAATKLII